MLAACTCKEIRDSGQGRRPVTANEERIEKVVSSPRTFQEHRAEEVVLHL